MRKQRKNYLPTVILIIVLWGLLGVLITQVEPELVKNILIPGLYLPFFLLLLPTSFLTLAILLANTKRGLLIALGLNAFLILRGFELGNFLNLILIVGIVIAMDRYLEG